MKTVMVAILLAIASWNANAADTVTSGTVTRADVTLIPGITVVTLTWVSDSSGNVVATLRGIAGTVKRITYKPGSGDLAPENLYDVTLTDQDGIDILTASGANLSNSTAKNYAPFVGNGTSNNPLPTYGDLALAITGAGAANSGTIRLFLTPGF